MKSQRRVLKAFHIHLATRTPEIRENAWKYERGRVSYYALQRRHAAGVGKKGRGTQTQPQDDGVGRMKPRTTTPSHPSMHPAQHPPSPSSSTPLFFGGKFRGGDGGKFRGGDGSPPCLRRAGAPPYSAPPAARSTPAPHLQKTKAMEEVERKARGSSQAGLVSGARLRRLPRWLVLD